MKIKVTKEHIGNGWRGNAESCPIGLAVCEALGYNDKGPLFVTRYGVTYNNARIADFKGKLKKCKDFIIAFDAGEPVKPFTFEV